MPSSYCDYCGNKVHEKGVGIYTVSMPFCCRRCGGNFCGKCRLPENHNCTGLPIVIDLRYCIGINILPKNNEE